jgi:hypothetical protein
MKLKNAYLIAKYSAHPRKKHATGVAGYMKDPNNVKWDEQVNITLGLKNKDFLAARIVLNITEQKVERNSFQNDKSFMELFEYFYNANPKEISQALQSIGINVGKKEHEHIQENVHSEAEAGQGSESSATADVAGPGQGPTLDEGSAAVAAEPVATTAG